jgi:hypothetical protein
MGRWIGGLGKLDTWLDRKYRALYDCPQCNCDVVSICQRSSVHCFVR